MRFSLATLLVATLSTAVAIDPPSPDHSRPKPVTTPYAPKFTPLVSAAVEFVPLNPSYPMVFGARINRGYAGGTMTGPDGKLLAKFLPFGANNGIVDAKGQIHVDARMSFQWVDDQTYGYLVAVGPAPNLYITFETNSTVHDNFNHVFSVANFTLVGNTLNIAAFQLTAA